MATIKVLLQCHTALSVLSPFQCDGRKKLYDYRYEFVRCNDLIEITMWVSAIGGRSQSHRTYSVQLKFDMITTVSTSLSDSVTATIRLFGQPFVRWQQQLSVVPMTERLLLRNGFNLLYGGVS